MMLKIYIRIFLIISCSCADLRVSDEMLKRAMEEEALLMKDKENRVPNTKDQVSDPIERQLKSLTESLRSSDDKTSSAGDTADPAIEFSFMNSSTASTPAPIQIRNSFRGGAGVQGVAPHKRKTSGDGLFGEEPEIVEEQETSKRSRTDRESEKVPRRFFILFAVFLFGIIEFDPVDLKIWI